MICPYCNTENRDDQDVCYYCNRDLSMLRLIINKAKHHYIVALEHAERGRYKEAITELQHALELDRHNVNAHVVLGTVYARMGNLEKANEQWKEALKLNPMLYKAYEYLQRSEEAKSIKPRLNTLIYLAIVLLVSFCLNLAFIFYSILPKSGETLLRESWNAYINKDYGSALQRLSELEQTAKDDIILCSADVLRESINIYFDQQLRLVREAERQGRYYDALTEVRESLRRNPPLELKSIFQSMLTDLKWVLLQEINNYINGYYNNEVEYARVKAEIEKFLTAFSDDKIAKEMAEKLNGIQRDFIKKSLVQLKKKAEEGYFEEAISKARELANKFSQPGVAEQINEFIKEIQAQATRGLLKKEQIELAEEKSAVLTTPTITLVLASSPGDTELTTHTVVSKKENEKERMTTALTPTQVPEKVLPEETPLLIPSPTPELNFTSPTRAVIF